MTDENTQPPTVVEESKALGTYEVSWTMIYEATSPSEAVKQALAGLDDVVRLHTEGPNIFVVRPTSSWLENEVHFISADEAMEAKDNDE